MTLCSRFLEDIDTKINRPERHESAAVNEPPCGLSIFGKVDYTKKGFTLESIPKVYMQRMRHWILTNVMRPFPGSSKL